MFSLSQDYILSGDNINPRTLTPISGGKFTHAFQYKNRVYLLTNDISKKVFASFPWHKNLPNIRHIGQVIFKVTPSTNLVYELYVTLYYEEYSGNNKSWNRTLSEYSGSCVDEPIQPSRRKSVNVLRMISQAFIDIDGSVWDFYKPNIRKRGNNIVLSDPVYIYGQPSVY